jgi:AraC-like DNA-binding protein
MVFARFNGQVRSLLVGPLPSAGQAFWKAGAEILWIKFRLGTFMPHLPTRQMLDSETEMLQASSRSFWLHGSAWEFPDYENADTFISRLVHEEILAQDRVVKQILQGHPLDVPARTVRHRFLRATGLTRAYILQMERAQKAAALLEQGKPILDTVFESGYYDQPHLTRSLKQWIGHTPAQLLAMSQQE